MSCLSRCSYFRGVLNEGFHCTHVYTAVCYANSCIHKWLKDRYSVSCQVMLGGGQEAMDVTTTTTKAGEFNAPFYHLVYEEEIGRVKGHFRPIISLRFHPDGKGIYFTCT